MFNDGDIVSNQVIAQLRLQLPIRARYPFVLAKMLKPGLYGESFDKLIGLLRVLEHAPQKRAVTATVSGEFPQYGKKRLHAVRSDLVINRY